MKYENSFIPCDPVKEAADMTFRNKNLLCENEFTTWHSKQCDRNTLISDVMARLLL